MHSGCISAKTRRSTAIYGVKLDQSEGVICFSIVHLRHILTLAVQMSILVRFYASQSSSCHNSLGNVEHDDTVNHDFGAVDAAGAALLLFEQILNDICYFLSSSLVFFYNLFQCWMLKFILIVFEISKLFYFI